MALTTLKIAQTNAARTLISFCISLSSIGLVAMLLMQLVGYVRCTFVLFPLLVTGFSCDAGGGPVSWKTEEFASQRGEEHLRRTLLLVYGAKIEIGMGPKMMHVTADTCARCGEHGESRMVYEPDAPLRVTEVKTGGAALGPIVLSLLFLLTVERMLEPQLLPLNEDGPTEDLVCVV
jgi:hypothetical protein